MIYDKFTTVFIILRNFTTKSFGLPSKLTFFWYFLFFNNFLESKYKHKKNIYGHFKPKK